MACPICGLTDACDCTQITPRDRHRAAVAAASEFARVPVNGAGRTAVATGATAVPLPSTASTGTPAYHPGVGTCRCGAPSVGECWECTRQVCAEHSDLWRGWRVCDRDIAKARMRQRAAAAEEERRVREAAAAAVEERRRLRNTLLDLSHEDALWLLYVQEPRTEQEIRSAVHVLLGLSADAFTRLCLALLPEVTAPIKGKRGRLRRASGWPFTSPHRQDRSWFLTRKGVWYRSSSHDGSGAPQDHVGKKIRLDDTEKRAVVHRMSWRHSMSADVPR